MECYRIVWKNSAKKELRNIEKKEIIKILNEIEKLSLNPYPNNHKKLLGTEYTFRIRIGNYRVVYSVIDKELLVEVIRVRHRREVYKNLSF
jgi:mRNA interferase RelE/StbE